MSEFRWTEEGEPRSARWHSESGFAPPADGKAVGDTLTAAAAVRFAGEGRGLLWRGDFHNAGKLMAAMSRRVDRRPAGPPPASPAEAYRRHRDGQERRARMLGMLLLPFEADHGVPLRRAPDVRLACREAHGDAAGPYVASLRELQGVIGAHEWRTKGVAVRAVRGHIYPHYGVFSPIRGEVADLVGHAPLPSRESAFDVGTGTGVLAVVLARRRVGRIVATDIDPRAVACARENFDRLGLTVETRLGDLFPEGRASLIVCNPPWLPGEPTSSLERAVYDPESRMLRAFIAGLAAHLEPGGEGWLILSDLAEQLGLRTRDELLAAFAAGGLAVAGRMEAKATHPKSRDPDDPLHDARAAERTILWRLRPSKT